MTKKKFEKKILDLAKIGRLRPARSKLFIDGMERAKQEKSLK